MSTPKYLGVSAGVRYWEDAYVNGVEDSDGSRIPFRSGDDWTPVIDISTGRIEAWPEGTVADIHYKVCDDGEYTLLDSERREICRISGYVPPILYPEGNGFGDYIIMKVGADGVIGKWKITYQRFPLAKDAAA
ncbi:MAG: hypothetical protein J0I45_16170 [Bosea sp.]|nr:hypothetical protein [Bosea sp. (in: a-proteobacteria)]